MRTKKDGLKRTRGRIRKSKVPILKKAISEHLAIARKRKQESIANKEKTLNVFMNNKGELYYKEIKALSRIDDDYQLRRILSQLLKEKVIEDIEIKEIDENGFDRLQINKHRIYRKYRPKT